MKQILCLIILMYTGQCLGQSLRDVSRSDNITWFGVDYSLVKLVDFNDELTPKEFKNDLLLELDFIPFDGPDSNKLNRYYRKRLQSSNTDEVLRRNGRINVNEIFVDKNEYLEYEEIDSLVSDLDVSGSGYGLICVGESLDERISKMSMWVVYFRKEDKTVISAIRYTQDCHDPLGTGILHKWKSAAEHILESAGFELRKYK